jgi:RNA recognition motif-containing protein
MTSATLYVSNLPFSITELELRHFFEAYGAVRSAKLVLDRTTGMSRGFGFVTLEASEAAERALHALDGTELGGRRLHVDEANERGAR